MDKNKNMGLNIPDHLSDKDKRNDNKEFQDWLNESEENKELFNKYKKIWKASDILSISKSFSSEIGWKEINTRIQQKTIRIKRLQNAMYTVIGMAASIILILAFAFYTNWFSSGDKVILTTEYGSRTEVILPDGSQVNLNSGTELEYNFNKITQKRELHFTGEAYFKIAKSEKPFVIYTPQGMELKVLGTEFNLSAYPEDKFVQTALVKGSVEIKNNFGDELQMKAGQIVQFNNKTSVIAFVNKNQKQLLGWINQKMYLDKTSLEDISIKLERWFDVGINFEPASLGSSIHYTGTLEEETIIDVLEALEELSDITYSIKGKEIIITKK